MTRSGSKVAPECSCCIASICQHQSCCYYGEMVPENVRSVLVPPETAAAALKVKDRIIARMDREAEAYRRLRDEARKNGALDSAERFGDCAAGFVKAIEIIRTEFDD